MTALKRWRNYFFIFLSLSLIFSAGLLALGEKPEKPPLLAAPAEGRRFEVHKDLYRSQEGERLHSRISCETSRLQTTPLIEHMEKVTAILQYKFDGDSQEIRTFASPQGIYDYNTQTFQSDFIHFSFYREPGHLFPSSIHLTHPFLEGAAEQVTLLIEDKPDFKAEKFQANVTLD